MITKKKKPKFNVLNFGFFKSVKGRWRKPRGTHNKKRMKFKWAGALPKVGYKNASQVRGLRGGMAEVLVSTPSTLDGLKNVLIRIASQVGGKKRKVILDKAKSLGLKVVNAGVADNKKFMPKAKIKTAAKSAKNKSEVKGEKS
jgi:large subunit ribosomal protein L32e